MLARHGVMGQTAVRTDSMSSYVPAMQVPELAAMFSLKPAAGESAPERFYVSRMANGGFNSTNAHLFVFDDYICIEPQRAMSVMSMNFSKSGYQRQYIGLHEVVALEKGFMARRHIRLADGSDVLIGTWSSKVFKAIEARRKSHFERRGIPAPPLKR